MHDGASTLLRHCRVSRNCRAQQKVSEILPLTVSVEGQTLEESRGLDVTVKDKTLRIRAERFGLSRWEAVSIEEDPWYVMNLCNAADIPAKPFLLRR